MADANLLTYIVQNASEDIKEALEQDILYDQYDSMDEVVAAVRQMTQDAGSIKAVFFCPLVGNIDEGDGDFFTVIGYVVFDYQLPNVGLIQGGQASTAAWIVIILLAVGVGVIASAFLSALRYGKKYPLKKQ